LLGEVLEVFSDEALDEEAEQQVDKPGILFWTSEFAGFGSRQGFQV